jgi:excinuclease UvrABC nuclease subunit
VSACVYRMRDKRGRLLYVGCSAHFVERLTQHSRSTPWWTQVVSVEVKHFRSWEAAFAAETRAILAEHPLYNLRAKGVPAFLTQSLETHRRWALKKQRELAEAKAKTA